jgi:hypothetical protein
MIIHWLINVFQEPLTSYWETAPIGVRTLYGIVFGYGLATLLLIIWVRFFSAKWLPCQDQPLPAKMIESPGSRADFRS